LVLDMLTELLRPLLQRDPHLSARAAARRLVAWGSIEFELEDRARRVGGRLRRDLAAIADHRQRRVDIEVVAEGIEVAK
jgi:hypothetical protein